MLILYNCGFARDNGIYLDIGQNISVTYVSALARVFCSDVVKTRDAEPNISSSEQY